MTPEGKVKAMVDNVLETVALTKPIWWFKPVQAGFGKPALDYIGCCNGRFFSVETKRPGKSLTQYQRITARDMLLTGAAVFIISKPDGASALLHWLRQA